MIAAAHPAPPADVRTRSGWFRIGNEFLARISTVGLAATAVYIVLVRHTGGDGSVHPSMRTIARVCGVSLRTAHRAVAALCDAGLIGVQRSIGPDGVPLPNRYTIYPLEPGDTGAPTGRHGRIVSPQQVPADLACDDGTTAHIRKTKDKDLKSERRTLPADLQIPPALDTPAFRAAWGEWLVYRRERRLTLTPRTLRGQLAKLESAGEPAAIQATRDSIDAGWSGLFPRSGGNGSGRAAIRVGPGQRSHALRPEQTF